ncbi:MAG: hypothetical protein AB7V16_12740 [Vulcanibacillus sp.]
MLQVDRIKIVIKTSNGNYGFNETFNRGLNFIASEKNTSGKSSILSAIYYGLGLEEIIGGRGDKVLTSVYKHILEDAGELYSVLESSIYLQINNGENIITLYRTAKVEGRDNRLITVYYGDIDNIHSENVTSDEFYVHMPNSAVNQKGFHTFLEIFLHLKLPLVATTDDFERKLYLQVVFSAIFIEQKRGWSDILSGMPYLGIKDSKKRAIEYILGLDVLDNEQKRLQIQFEKSKIENEWNKTYTEISIECNREDCVLEGISNKPQIIDEGELSGIHIFIKNIDKFSVEQVIIKLEEDYKILINRKKKVVENYDQLQNELIETEDSIKKIGEKIKQEKAQLNIEKGIIDKLCNSIELIDTDISNNKDALRLKKLGASLDCLTAKETCPVCNQHIKDSLLIGAQFQNVMSIDDNITHLEQQRKMMDFSMSSHEKYRSEVIDNIDILTKKYFSLMKLAKSIRNDLFSVNEDVSETVVQKRLIVREKIDNLIKLKNYVNDKKLEFLILSERWGDYLSKKALIPSSHFSKLDEEKMKYLKDQFVLRLRKYGYKSAMNIDDIVISHETYLPIIDNFDMKFDSSASDNIRAIWAYTVSLLNTSKKLHGNHPNVLIFDEPDQHSIVTTDMKHFFEDIVEQANSCQIFVGITVVDTELENILNGLSKDKCKIIDIGNKGFVKI